MKHSSLLASAFLGAILLVMPGCGLGGYGGHGLRFKSIGKKSKTEIQPNVKDAFYRVDRDGHLYFILRGKTAPGGVDQTVIVRVFWQPIGGSTSLNPTSLNSTFRYLVENPTGMGQYEGAGFVRLYTRVGKTHLRARIISGEVRLTESTQGFVDTLKRAEISGAISATHDDGSTLRLSLDAQRNFFKRSFLAAKLLNPADVAPATDENGGGPNDASTMPTFELPTPLQAVPASATAPATDTAPAADSAPASMPLITPIITPATLPTDTAPATDSAPASMPLITPIIAPTTMPDTVPATNP